MKRAAHALILLLAAGRCLGAPCHSVRDGDWSDPGTWGGLPCAPGIADGVTIGHRVRGDLTDTIRIGRLTISRDGELNMVAGPRILELNDTVSALILDGVLRPANGTEIRFHQSGGMARLSLGSTGRILSDGVDLGPLREVLTVDVSPTSGPCVDGERWTVTLDDAGGIVAGDTAKFHPGGTAGRGAVEGMAYEVVAAAADSVTLCPELPDALSRGQRFTAHRPSTAVAVPDAGAGAPIRRPAPGDRLLVFQPWWIRKTGSVSWRLDSSGIESRSELMGGDFSGSADLSFRCAAEASGVTVAHSNFHDGFDASTGVRFLAAQPGGGCARALVAWNTFHDTELADFQAHVIFHDNLAGPVDGGAVIGNTFYRTQHNNIGINSSADTDPILRHSVEYNVAFDIGRSGGGECEFIEMDRSEENVVRFNVGWELSRNCGCIRSKGRNVHNLYAFNYCQGAGKGGIEVGSRTDIQRDNILINNYVEDSGDAALSGIPVTGYAVYYNVARNCRNGTCYDAIRAEGNVADARDHPDNHTGFRTDNMEPGGSSAGETRLWRNNVCVDIGDARVNSCLVTEVTGGEGETDVFDLEWAHNVFFMDDDPSFGFRLRHTFPGSASAVAELHDNVCVGDAAQGNQFCYSGGSRSGTTVTVHGMSYWNTLAFAGVPDVAANVHERDPLFVDDAADWNLQPASAEWTAGNDPPGSPIGIRARRFDYSIFPAFIRNTMTVYPDVSNEPAQDDDLDGWLAFLAGDPDSPDNCPAATNVEQADLDADRSGDVCDCSDANPTIVGPAGIVAGVGFDAVDPATLRWSPDSQAETYYVYRGARPPGAPFSYDHGCLTPAGVDDPSFTDATTPSTPGGMLYYLVSGGNSDCAESELGVGGVSRPNAQPCLADRGRNGRTADALP